MRWCFVCHGYRVIHVLGGDTRTTGGAEAQIARLAAALARLGHESALIYGDGRGLADRKVVAGVTCIDAAPAWRRPASLARFWRALNFLSPDLLYARLPNDFLWVMGLFARRHRDARFMYALANDLHCSPWTAYDYKRWFHAPVYALGLWSADVIAIQHAGQRNLLSPSLRNRTVHVPNLVHSIAATTRAYEATAFDAIWIAKIHPAKQLEIFASLAAALPGLRFAVAGGFDPTVSGALRASLEARLAGLPNVAFLGPQGAGEVMTLLAASKVLVNTSLSEGFPNTMLEAWSVGVPVVSLSVDPGGVIARERLGFVSGTEANLRRDVHALTSSELLNQELGGHGLAYVRRQHSLDAVCEALMRAIPGFQLAPASAKIRETRY